MRIPQIGVLSKNGRTPASLLRAVSELVPVRFVDGAAAPGQFDALLLLGFEEADVARLAGAHRRILAVIEGPAVATRSTAAIDLADSVAIERCLRARRLPDPAIERVTAISAAESDIVLARSGSAPLWLRRTVGHAVVDYQAVALPELHESEYLYARFQPGNWASLLPLLHFVFEVARWRRPPIRACFMFDDPNLHWKSYGYLRYGDLIEHARAHHYHATIATIPLDAWYVHPKAASLFRAHPHLVSLVAHGNNHTHCELTQPYPQHARLGLAAQALRRIERLEAAAGFRVPRVMTAPHGACNPEMADALLAAGFQAACISRSSLIVRNPSTLWPDTVGLTPAAFLGRGLPVLPRFHIRWERSHATFAAFLGQPIVLVGHHDDLSDGLGLLEEWASDINTLGQVMWTDLGTMAATNYVTRECGGVLDVHLFTRHASVKIPAGCTQMRIYRPWLTTEHAEDIVVRHPMRGVISSGGEVVPVAQEVEYEVEAVAPQSIARAEANRLTPWTVIRRHLCEVRDRLRPVIQRRPPQHIVHVAPERIMPKPSLTAGGLASHPSS